MQQTFCKSLYEDGTEEVHLVTPKRRHRLMTSQWYARKHMLGSLPRPCLSSQWMSCLSWRWSSCWGTHQRLTCLAVAKQTRPLLLLVMPCIASLSGRHFAECSLEEAPEERAISAFQCQLHHQGHQGQYHGLSRSWQWEKSKWHECQLINEWPVRLPPFEIGDWRLACLPLKQMTSWPLLIECSLGNKLPPRNKFC